MGDRVDPGRGLRPQPVDQFEHGRREAFPLEVGFVAGEKEELLADLILRKMKREQGRVVILEVVLVEVDRRAPSPVVEKGVVVEGRDHAGLERADEVLGELADGASGVHEAGQSRDEREPHRNVRDVRIEFVKAGRIFHPPTLTGGNPGRRQRRPARSCPERTGAGGRAGPA